MILIENLNHLKDHLKKKGIKPQHIIEEKNAYIVYPENKREIYKFLKPLSKEKALEKIFKTTPPTPYQSLIKFIENPIKNKAYAAIKHFLKSEKRVLLLTGSTGAGKTTVSLYGIYTFIRKRLVKNPLYFSVITDIRDEQLHLKVIEADGFVIDDLNVFVGKYDLSIARKIILYALENAKPLFITSNNTIDELTQAVFEQHIRSRIEAHGLIISIKDKDYRLQEVKSHENTK